MKIDQEAIIPAKVPNVQNTRASKKCRRRDARVYMRRTRGAARRGEAQV